MLYKVSNEYRVNFNSLKFSGLNNSERPLIFSIGTRFFFEKVSQKFLQKIFSTRTNDSKDSLTSKTGFRHEGIDIELKIRNVNLPYGLAYCNNLDENDPVFKNTVVTILNFATIVLINMTIEDIEGNVIEFL